MGKAQTDKGVFMQGRRPTLRKPRPVGRVTKLTPEVSKKITDAIRAGNHLNVAAQYAGVGPATLQEWLMRGRGEHPTLSAATIYAEFTNDVSEAQAAAEVAAVLHWRSAMPKDWHSAKDWLKVSHPDRWDADRDKIGPIAAVQVNLGANSGPNAPEVHEMPLSHLIEDSPAFLKAVMPLFDAVDDVYGPNGANSSQNDVNSAEMHENAPNDAKQLSEGTFEAESVQDAVYDAKEGTWRVIDPENDEMDAESA
jgi:hypothetical protein